MTASPIAEGREPKPCYVHYEHFEYSDSYKGEEGYVAAYTQSDIDALTSANEKLRSALHELVDAIDDDQVEFSHEDPWVRERQKNALKAASAALRGDKS